jgi:hypothetical protein
VDPLIEKVKALLGDAWEDGWAEELTDVGSSAISAAVKSAIDEEKAKRLAAKKQATEATATVAKLKEQLEAAGQTDEALKQALEAAAKAQAETAQLQQSIRARDIADAATKALMGAELEGGRRIPADRLGSALKLLDLSGVDLDEAGAVRGWPRSQGRSAEGGKRLPLGRSRQRIQVRSRR